MRSRSGIFAAALLVAIFIAHITSAEAELNPGSAQSPPSTSFDFRSDWEVLPGLAVERDVAGFDLPTGIAFVPEPGTAPDDPLYFVTELAGKIKVVTQDRQVLEFAHVNAYSQEVGAHEFIEAGLAGICLAPEHGYVFVTFAAKDKDGLLRNRLVRFTTTPGTFGRKASEQLDLSQAFAGVQAAVSHQIGACQIDGQSILVSVADGGDPGAGQSIDKILGKIVRLSFEGEALSDNPFFGKPGASPNSGYVWAYGFRNPFGLKLVEEGVFVAENGPSFDRFLRADRGQNHLWDGSDQSIAMLGTATFSPAIGPVQLDYLAAGGPLPTAFTERFYVAATGEKGSSKGIWSIPYDLGTQRHTATPSQVVRYVGPRYKTPGLGVTGLAVGPDGLYFTPILPNSVGESWVLKLVADPDNEYPFRVGMAAAGKNPGRALFQARGCPSCHIFQRKGGTFGPRLDLYGIRYHQVLDRITSPSYAERLKELDALEVEPFLSTREARAEVLNAHDEREKLILYAKNKILEPKFDGMENRMPNLGLTESEAQTLATYLVDPGSLDKEGRSLPQRVRDLIPLPGSRPGDVLAGVLMGSVGGAGGVAALVLAWWFFTRRSRKD